LFVKALWTTRPRDKVALLICFTGQSWPVLDVLS
jgi:hypothetical protein